MARPAATVSARPSAPARWRASAVVRRIPRLPASRATRQHREQRAGALLPRHVAACLRPRAKPQIVLHRQRLEHLAAFGHREMPAVAPMGGQPLDRPASSRIRPVIGCTPEIACISVVLPAPFAPISVTISPRVDLQRDAVQHLDAAVGALTFSIESTNRLLRPVDAEIGFDHRRIGAHLVRACLRRASVRRPAHECGRRCSSPGACRARPT